MKMGASDIQEHSEEKEEAKRKEREEGEEVIKEQLNVENCSPGKYYPFNDETWRLFESKGGRKKT